MFELPRLAWWHWKNRDVVMWVNMTISQCDLCGVCRSQWCESHKKLHRKMVDEAKEYAYND